MLLHIYAYVEHVSRFMFPFWFGAIIWTKQFPVSVRGHVTGPSASANIFILFYNKMSPMANA